MATKITPSQQRAIDTMVEQGYVKTGRLSRQRSRSPKNAPIYMRAIDNLGQPVVVRIGSKGRTVVAKWQ